MTHPQSPFLLISHRPVPVAIDGLINEPLTPATLDSLQVLGTIRPAVPSFDPQGEWSLTYRIWGNHSRRAFQNKIMGYLRLTKRAAEANTFTIEVNKMIINAGPIIHQIEATMECHRDSLASPLAWEYTSSFLDTAFCRRDELTLHERGTLQDGKMIRRQHDRETCVMIDGPLVAGWALFDVLQRGQTAFRDFVYFDGLRHLKGNQVINVLAQPSQRVGENQLELRGIYHIGQGIAPTEYWLDDASRIVAICSNSMCFILDEQAEQKAWKCTEELLQGGVHYEY